MGDLCAKEKNTVSLNTPVTSLDNAAKIGPFA